MKSICIFGAGKSATCLIHYLESETKKRNWQLYVADSHVELITRKLSGNSSAIAIGLDATDDAARQELVSKSDLVISMLPPHLHKLLALDCLRLNKHLLTASYVDQDIRDLENDIAGRGLLFLCEMGLDPGIDHMSALQLIHGLKARGATIHRFRSHCGGLVAPESDDNPWRYKISWNPRNIVQAGKSGATYRENGQEVHLDYEHLFDPTRVISVPDLGYLAWYPNRDSLNYISLYGLEEARDFVRTTLRFPEFCFGWKNIIDLKLTDETPQYETDGMSLRTFFQEHFDRYGFGDWVEKQLTARLAQSRQLLEKLQELLEAEQGVEEDFRTALQDFMMIDDNGRLMDVNLDEVKTKAAATVAGQMHEANLSMKQLLFLGMDDNDTIINKGLCSALDVLQFAVERKLALQPDDRDMIVMLHEIGYELEGQVTEMQSSLVVKGDDRDRTAMAKTVGLPLGIAAIMVLEGRIAARGLHIPVLPEIYEPVLRELEKNGIKFQESTRLL